MPTPTNLDQLGREYLVAEKVGRVLAEAFAFADASSIDLLGEMTGKVAVCEARWGGSRG